MTELDQAPADSAHGTDHGERQPDQRPGSYDNQGYPHGTTAADTDPARYDGDIHAAIAGDTTPTRQAAARQDAADNGRGNDVTSPDGDTDIQAILHEDDHLPDPRARQQAARDDAADNGQATDTTTVGTAGETPPAGRDADIDAILHEDDHLPDPRARQQAARDDIADVGAAIEHDAAAADQQPSGPDPLTEAIGNEARGGRASVAENGEHEDRSGASPTEEDRARWHDSYQDYLKDPPASRGTRPEETGFDGREVELTHRATDGIWVEGLPGESPSRVGEVLRSREDPEQRRIEKLRKEFNKEAETVLDVGGKWADTVHDLLDRTPPPTHSMTHDRSPEQTPAGPEHGMDAGHSVEAALTLVLVGVAGTRKLHEMWQGVRERRQARRKV